MSSGTRPTWASQTCAVSSLPSGKGTVTFTGSPSASAGGTGGRSPGRGRRSRVSGSPFGSSAGYRSACQPSADSDWVKYPCR